MFNKKNLTEVRKQGAPQKSLRAAGTLNASAKMAFIKPLRINAHLTTTRPSTNSED
jgi:hypothetical protein